MNNNLPQEYKKSFLKSLIEKIKLVFNKNDAFNYDRTDKDEKIVETKKVESKKELIAGEVNFDKRYEKEIFMNKLKNHPEMLEMFPIEKLAQILNYYLDENKKKEEKLMKLKHQTNL